MYRVNFVHPEFLFLLFAIPILVFIHFLSLIVSKGRALRFANFQAIERIRNIDFFSKNLTVLFLSVFITVCLSFSLAGTFVYLYRDTSAYCFVVAVDASRSMDSGDIPPSRLEAAKQAAETFIDATPPGTLIGVVSYAGVSYIEKDLTDFKTLAKQAVEEIEFSKVGGTDIQESIINSINLLRTQKNAKAVILFSDGQMNVGVVEKTIEYALENSVVIHTIGIGTLEGGDVGYGTSKLDEAPLKALAFNTGGFYTRLSDLEENPFEEVISKTKKMVPVEISEYLILTAIICFFLMFILVSLRYKTIP